MMETDLVSIIMPCFNATNYIEESIKSVISQTYQNWELLICDDVSLDGTYDFIKKNFKDERIKLFTLEINSGAAAARNLGVLNSRGRYIAFIDSDDVWFPEKLERQISFMQKNEIYFSATSYNKIDEYSRDINKIINVKSEYSLEDILKNNVGNSTVVYDSKIIGKPKIPLIKKRNDYLYWITILQSNPNIRIYGLEEVLSSHRVHNSSLSSSKRGLVKYHWQIYKDILDYGIVKSAYICGYWMFKGIRNKIIDRIC